MTEETLSDKIHVPSDFLAMDDELHEFILTEHVKEFIKNRDDRIENQLRIHWGWLKKQPYTEIVKFIKNISDKLAGEELL